MTESYLLVMQNIAKAFPGVLAVDGVTLRILPGEIHALVGENGAGKSTLMRILSGATKPDSGSIFWRGEEVQINSPHDAQTLGISMIHQELAVIPYLDIGKNVFLGREPRGIFPGLIGWSALYHQAQKQMARLGLNFDPRTPVSALSISQQQMVEVTKALSMNASLIIMDEPTSALTERETEALFNQMVRLRDQGVSIIFISHRLEEVFQVADRLTVLRDGKFIGTETISKLSKKQVVTMMVGRALSEEKPRNTRTGPKEIILETSDLHNDKDVHGLSIQARKGEILGVSGLVGAGRTSMAELIFGVQKPTKGRIIFRGQEIQVKSPSQAINLGIGFVPEDRKAQALFLNMAVKQNVAMASLSDLAHLGFVQKKKVEEITRKMVQSLDIRMASINQRARNLSGGNQQKVVISRWLALEPILLILDEPTRGIDVGAKAEIHTLLRKMAMDGVAIIMISSELPEILGVSDRIVVVRDGKIAMELDPATTTQDEIMHAAAWSENGISISS